MSDTILEATLPNIPLYAEASPIAFEIGSGIGRTEVGREDGREIALWTPEGSAIPDASC